MGLGVCDSLCRVRNNFRLCSETSRYRPSRCDSSLGFVVVFWHLAGGRNVEVFLAEEGCVPRGDPPYFVARPRLSCDLCWMAISGALPSGSATASVDSRGPDDLALCRETATLSSAALAMDPDRRHRCGRAASD